MGFINRIQDFFTGNTAYEGNATAGATMVGVGELPPFYISETARYYNSAVFTVTNWIGNKAKSVYWHVENEAGDPVVQDDIRRIFRKANDSQYFRDWVSGNIMWHLIFGQQFARVIVPPYGINEGKPVSLTNIAPSMIARYHNVTGQVVQYGIKLSDGREIRILAEHGEHRHYWTPDGHIQSPFYSVRQKLDQSAFADLANSKVFNQLGIMGMLVGGSDETAKRIDTPRAKNIQDYITKNYTSTAGRESVRPDKILVDSNVWNYINFEVSNQKLNSLPHLNHIKSEVANAVQVSDRIFNSGDKVGQSPNMLEHRRLSFMDAVYPQLVDIRDQVDELVLAPFREIYGEDFTIRFTYDHLDEFAPNKVFRFEKAISILPMSDNERRRLSDLPETSDPNDDEIYTIQYGKPGRDVAVVGANIVEEGLLQESNERSAQRLPQAIITKGTFVEWSIGSMKYQGQVLAIAYTGNITSPGGVTLKATVNKPVATVRIMIENELADNAVTIFVESLTAIVPELGAPMPILQVS